MTHNPMNAEEWKALAEHIKDDEDYREFTLGQWVEQRNRLVATIQTQAAELERLRELLTEGLENADLSLPTKFEDRRTEPHVKAISELGYGAIMSSASRLWRSELKPNMKGGEFCVGPCVSTQRMWTDKVRQALSSNTEETET